jgi:DNA repair protein RadD
MPMDLYMNRFWNKPCYEFDIKEAIEKGILCKYRAYGGKHSYDLTKIKKTGDDYTKEQLKEIIKTAKAEKQVEEIVAIANRENRKKVAILCSNIEHAEKVNQLVSGYEESVLVHSKIKNYKKEIDRFKNTDVRFCVSVLILSEGFDCPETDMVVFLRPTRSPRLMIQACGRGLRIGKENDCLFLDYGDVFITCGTPDNPIYQFLDKSEKSEAAPKRCQNCHFIYELGNICPACGHENSTPRDVEKNLKSSISEVHKTFEETFTKKHFYRSGLTKKGQKYCTFKKWNDFYSFFGGFNKAIMGLTRGGWEVKVTFKAQGKYPQCIRIEKHNWLGD